MAGKPKMGSSSNRRDRLVIFVGQTDVAAWSACCLLSIVGHLPMQIWTIVALRGPRTADKTSGHVQ
jgi:hypothetical protein